MQSLLHYLLVFYYEHCKGNLHSRVLRKVDADIKSLTMGDDVLEEHVVRSKAVAKSNRAERSKRLAKRGFGGAKRRGDVLHVPCGKKRP